MSLIKLTETLLDKLFRYIPHLSKAARKSVASIWPVLAVILAVAQILAVAGLWHLSKSMQAVSSRAILYKDLLDGPLPLSTQKDYVLVYVGTGIIMVSAVLFLLSAAELKKHTSRGWFMVAAAILLNILYGFVMLFIDGRGAQAFIITLIGSVAGLYLLQQTKTFYIKNAKSIRSKKKTVNV